ncbi:MAG: EAL domain-containing protein [Proteobacteria bacterium]|nr:EAL domain-containing protein [Pseudomonadota bacterium]
MYNRRGSIMDAEPLNSGGDTGITPAELILSSLSDGVIGVNQDGAISFINPTACTLTGKKQSEAIGKPLREVFALGGNAQSLEPEYIKRILNRHCSVGPITKQQLKVAPNKHILIDYSITPLDSNSAVVMFHDLSHIEENSRTLLYQVSYDPLTRLPNRYTLQQTLNQTYNRFKATEGTFSVLLLDLDRFKLVNDSYGHAAGDKLLKDVAKLMGESLRPQDKIGRWGGEEFICLLPESNLSDSYTIAERIRKSLEQHSITVNERHISTSTSIGIANYPSDGNSVEEILRVADAMLYEAKRDGRNTTNSSLNSKTSILTIARQLEDAINNNRIIPAYQPIVNLTDGEIIAEEALARIIGPNDEIIEANKFIEAALQLELVHKIDHTIIKQAITSCSTRLLDGNKPLKHFVNISADLLRHPDLVEDIVNTAVGQCTACGDLMDDEKPLVIEITEHQLISDVNEAKRILEPLLDFGLQLAVDDFGSGYSSLQYLADLPISFLKIEGELVRRVSTDKRIRAILSGIQMIANDLGLTTIAEYVEDEATMNELQEIGVHWGQGNYFGKPQLIS